MGRDAHWLTLRPYFYSYPLSGKRNGYPRPAHQEALAIPNYDTEVLQITTVMTLPESGTCAKYRHFLELTMNRDRLNTHLNPVASSGTNRYLGYVIGGQICHNRLVGLIE